MIPNMNPRQMEKMMSQMGIKSRQVNATRVIIESEGERIIVSEPQVTEITMQGQKSYQIAGKVSTESTIKEEDIKMVMEQAKCTEAQAKEALQKTGGDIAQAIMEIAGEE